MVNGEAASHTISHAQTVNSMKTDAAMDREKAAASSLSALFLLALLLAFAVLLKTNATCLYKEIAGSISVYVLIMIGLALSCWMLTWTYIVWINRIEMKERK